MAKSGKSTAVDSRKAASAKKQQEKQAARRRAKEEKLAKKSERVFAKSLASFEKSSAERARAFVDQQLDDNPGWVRPLADLMRDGALQALIRSGAAEAEGLSGGPRRWSGKAKSFGCLPDECNEHMLQTIGVKIQDGGVSEDTLTAVFCLQFFVDPDTPLPPNCRSFDALAAMAQERFATLGSKTIVSEVKEAIECYTIEDGTVTCPLTDEKVALPSLSGHSWELTDSSLPSCSIVSTSNSAVSFAVRTLFQVLRTVDPEAKWTAKKK